MLYTSATTRAIHLDLVPDTRHRRSSNLLHVLFLEEEFLILWFLIMLLVLKTKKLIKWRTYIVTNQMEIHYWSITMVGWFLGTVSSVHQTNIEKIIIPCNGDIWRTAHTYSRNRRNIELQTNHICIQWWI